MARKRTRIPPQVFLNGLLVGHLRRETSGAIDFQYHPTWLEWEHTFAVSLSLPLREDRYLGLLRFADEFQDHWQDSSGKDLR